MLTIAQVREEADLLLAAQQDRVPAPLLSARHPATSVADAYRIADEVVEARLRSGDQIVGYKIGLTSLAAQQMAGIDEPDFGVLLASKVYASGAVLARQDTFRPALEPELGFRLAHDLRGPGVDVADVLAATHEIIPCLEVVDSRYDAGVRLIDSIADNASAHAIIVGDVGMPPESVDRAQVAVALRIDDRVEAEGTGAAVMGDPAAAVAWLVNKLAEFEVGLKAGHIVLSGSMTQFVYVDTTAHAVGDFGPLGQITVSILDERSAE